MKEEREQNFNQEEDGESQMNDSNDWSSQSETDNHPVHIDESKNIEIEEIVHKDPFIKNLGTNKKEENRKTIGIVVGSYFVVSMGLVFLNKILMEKSFFPYPLFITWLQFLIAFACFFLSSHYSSKSKIAALGFITPIEFQIPTAKKVIPVTIVYLLMLITNNLCLYYVEVTYYQIARSLTIIFTALLSYYLLKKNTSANAQIACGVIIAGFIFGSKGEVNFSLVGVLFGIFSSFFVGLYSVAIKYALLSLNDDHWKLLFYNTVISIVVLLPFVLLSGELASLFENGVENIGKVIFLNFIAGLFGFVLNIVMALQIKYTSPLTNIISGTAKASLQTILAFIFFQSPISFLNIIGTILVMGGSGAYSYIRYLEMNK